MMEPHTHRLTLRSRRTWLRNRESWATLGTTSWLTQPRRTTTLTHSLSSTADKVEMTRVWVESSSVPYKEHFVDHARIISSWASVVGRTGSSRPIRQIINNVAFKSVTRCFTECFPWEWHYFSPLFTNCMGTKRNDSHEIVFLEKNVSKCGRSSSKKNAFPAISLLLSALTM